MKWAVRRFGDLGDALTLAPERHVLFAAAAGSAEAGAALEELVVERNERVTVREMQAAGGGVVVLDTTHARDGVLDVASARLAEGGARSAKKRAHPGDLLVSRLRPYLRQVALVHPAALGASTGALAAPAVLAVSTEFYVLAPKTPGASLAWLLPWFLSSSVQSALASAQEGGHHPRVPRASLFALRVPSSAYRARARTGRALDGALAAYYAASSGVRRALLLR
jgi:hypothetical protein